MTTRSPSNACVISQRTTRLRINTATPQAIMPGTY
jgi:hypothetical protein